MKDRITVSAVSYVNSYPFIYGLQNHAVAKDIRLELDTPADCARKLISGKVDVGLVPVAAIPHVSESNLITDYCIGADGPVETVCLFSEVPLTDVDAVLLDYQSMTSVQLVRMLAERSWRISPKWLPAAYDFIEKIQGSTAGVVIGDRAFELRERFPVVIDLSESWKGLTGLPFTFACWVSNRNLPEAFLAEFQAALAFGLDNKRQAVSSLLGHENAALTTYVEEVISYGLDQKKRDAMKLFLAWLSKSPKHVEIL